MRVDGSSSATIVPPPGIRGYRIEQLLGEGYGGRVWLATRLGTGETVALKVLGEKAAADPVQRDRFRREAQILGRGGHPHLVPLVEDGSAQDPPYMALQFLEGGDLTPFTGEQGRLPPAEALRVGVALARALSSLHAAGVLHRDVKPANVFLSSRREIFLGDLGMALEERGARLTARHQALGTLAYMAPELLAGRTATPAADVFALGVTVLELLTGRRPPISGLKVEVPEEFLAAVPVPSLRGMLRRCLRSAPEDRPSDPGEVRQAFEQAIRELEAEVGSSQGRRHQEPFLPAATAPPGLSPAPASPRWQWLLLLFGSLLVGFFLHPFSQAPRPPPAPPVPSFRDLILGGSGSKVLAAASGAGELGVLRDSGRLEILSTGEEPRPLSGMEVGRPGPRPHLERLGRDRWLVSWRAGPVLQARSGFLSELAPAGQVLALGVVAGRILGGAFDGTLVELPAPGVSPRVLWRSEAEELPVALTPLDAGRLALLLEADRDFGPGVPAQKDLRVVGLTLGEEEARLDWEFRLLAGPSLEGLPSLLADREGLVVVGPGGKGFGLVALDPGGKVLWMSDLPGPMTRAPEFLLSGRHLLIARLDDLEILDRHSGRSLSRVDLPSRGRSFRRLDPLGLLSGDEQGGLALASLQEVLRVLPGPAP